MLAALLALGTSLSWGISDFLGGLASRRREAAAVLLVGQLCGLVAILVTLAIVSPAWPGWDDAWPAVLGGVSWSFGILALYRALALGPMGVVAPLLTLSLPVTVIAGLASGERPSTVQLVGMVLAFGGLVQAVRRPPDDDGADDAATAVERRARDGGGLVPLGVLLAVVGALLLGGNLVAVDAVAQSSALWALAVVRLVGLAVMALVALPRSAATRRDTATLLRRPTAVPLIGLLDVAGSATFALAASEGDLSVVAVLATLFPALTLLMARVVLHERLAPRQLAGAALLLVGAALVAGG